MVLWTPRQEILFILSDGFANILKFRLQWATYGHLQLTYFIEKCSSHLATVNPLEKVAFVFFKTSNKMHSAKKASKCLSNTQEHGEARNSAWWQNIKIIYSRSLAARHNPTCSAGQRAVKHSSTLTCKNIFISSPVAKNRSFFIEVSKTVWNMYWQSYRERSAGEDSTAASLQTPSCPCIRIQVRKTRAASTQYLTFTEAEPGLSKRSLVLVFKKHVLLRLI